MIDGDKTIEVKCSLQQLLKDFLLVVCGIPFSYIFFSWLPASKNVSNKGSSLEWIIAVIVFAVAVGLMRMWFLSNCRLTLNNTGICYRNIFKKETSSPWSQVASYSVESFVDTKGRTKKCVILRNANSYPVFAFQESFGTLHDRELIMKFIDDKLKD